MVVAFTHKASMVVSAPWVRAFDSSTVTEFLLQTGDTGWHMGWQLINYVTEANSPQLP